MSRQFPAESLIASYPNWPFVGPMESCENCSKTFSASVSGQKLCNDCVNYAVRCTKCMKRFIGFSKSQTTCTRCTKKAAKEENKKQ